jgi:hypothetical protein
MMSCGKWAPLKLIAIVMLPHDAPLVMKEDHTANGLKCKFATKPLVGMVSLGDLAVSSGNETRVGETLKQVSEPAEPRR